MIGPVQGTPYDLRFAVFGVPVAVTPMFWLAAAIIGWPWLSGPNGHPLLLMTWMLCVFLSILVHEFGHAFAARAFGDRPQVLLYHFGGLTFPGVRETAGRSFLITAAGPALQLLLFGLVAAPAAWAYSNDRWPEPGTPANAATVSMLEINLLWPLFNLVPVLPLDGGRLVESGLAFCEVRAARTWARRLSVVAAVPVAALFFALTFYGGGLPFMGIVFLLLAVENYRALQGQGGPV